MKNSNANISKSIPFKGRLMVRCGDTICLGRPSDNHIAVIKILQSKKNNDLDIPTKLSIALKNVSPDVNTNRVEKHIEKESLSEALDVALVWLDRSESDK